MGRMGGLCIYMIFEWMGTDGYLCIYTEYLFYIYTMKDT